MSVGLAVSWLAAMIQDLTRVAGTASAMVTAFAIQVAWRMRKLESGQRDFLISHSNGK